MTALNQQLADHQSARPEMPRPFAPESTEAIEWHAAFTKWTREKERLLGRLAMRNNFKPETKIPRRAMKTGPWGQP